MANKHALGWIPDVPDHRDHLFSAPLGSVKALPKSVDLRSHGPKEIYDQGQLGSCTANAIAAAIEFDLLKQKAKAVFTPSRLFIYYNERVMEHSVASDAGAQIRDGVKSVAKLGAPPESLWPYSDKNPGAFQEKPGEKVYAEASKHTITSYQRVVRTLGQLKGCLAAGYPFVFGFSVYESFESEEVAKTGDAGLPDAGESLLGGHAVMAVGYDDKTHRFLVRNSWGAAWGKGGHFTLPYAYLLDPALAQDFWTVRTVQA